VRRTGVIAVVILAGLICTYTEGQTSVDGTAPARRVSTTFGTSGLKLTYVVLGDSTAAGIGGTYASGIAVSTARHLAQHNTVAMTNLAVSGARMSDVRRHQLSFAQALRPDVVLLAAGANDVTHLSGIRSMRADLRVIVRALRAANADVKIVITGSPDMGSPPRVPRLLRGVAAWRTKQVNRMFRSEAAARDLTFAPIADVTGPMFRKDRSLFASDRFHPNDRGYATWTAVLNEALTRATAEMR
jgi:lysophospholipase L1-like esterase